jgi:ribonuclease VapC
MASVRDVGAPTYVEAVAVLRIRRGPAGLSALDVLLVALGVPLVPLTPAAALHARDAYDRYGKGDGEAGSVLNFGDCLAYGVARDRQQPLLFRGADFPHTLIPAAPY